uniref:Uncharacterized protein n=1 Tax=Romanomermis culicivorax TaxID=13658 RepID=A0A915IY03_ROMCU
MMHIFHTRTILSPLKPFTGVPHSRRTPSSPERREKWARATHHWTRRVKETSPTATWHNQLGTMTRRRRVLGDALKACRINIACVQETKWKGTKAKEIGEGSKLFYNGEQATQSSVGIAVSERLRNSIVEVSWVSERLMSLMIDSGAVAL